MLSKLDGVEALNNILVIGMTNRKDMIDEADRGSHNEGLIDFEDFYRVMKKNCDDPLGEFDSDEDDEGVY